MSKEWRIFLDRIEGKKIYIYGAGIVGRLVKKTLCKLGMPVASFFVTSGAYDGEMYEDIPKKNFSKEEISGDFVIVISILPYKQDSICKVLSMAGISDFCCVNDQIIDDMREILVGEKRLRANANQKFSELYRLTHSEERIGVVFNKRIYLMPKKCEWVNECEQRIYSALIIIDLDYSIGIIDAIKGILNKYNGSKVTFAIRGEYFEQFKIKDIIRDNGYFITGYAGYCRNIDDFEFDNLLLALSPVNMNSFQHNKCCTGCALCKAICPVNAITIEDNKRGDCNPQIDLSKCINCGKCIKICKEINKNLLSMSYEQKCQCVVCCDSIRMKSSSGGLFYALAEKFLQDGGYVCGVVWGDDWVPQHVLTDDISIVMKMRGSKYVRGNMDDVYKKITDKLSSYKKVMFVGTPCQVAAVKKYIKKFANDYKDNFFSIDLLCGTLPSQSLWKNYLESNYDKESIDEIVFRDKSLGGWRGDSLLIRTQSRDYRKCNGDPYLRLYHNSIIKPFRCEYCDYASKERISDLTIGDFWDIRRHISDGVDDGKGTSCLLINTEKGEKLINKAKEMFRMIPANIEWLSNNRINRSYKASHLRERFVHESNRLSFNKMAEQVTENVYDVGLVGNWSYPNYGSQLTYYALYRTLIRLGLTVLMIEWPELSYTKPYGYSTLFDVQPYRNFEIAEPAISLLDMEKYNKKCRTFIHGSDQLLHPNLYDAFGNTIALKWTYEDKRRIGYALSFGYEHVDYMAGQLTQLAEGLNRYDAVSVRENSASTLMEYYFAIKADTVLDPVFLCDKEDYEKIAYKTEECSKRYKAYLFAYIINPDDSKIRFVENIAKKKGLKVVMQRDALDDYMSGKYTSVNKWLDDMINSDFVITDSYHGTCFALIFEKDFIAIKNKNRGETRFDSLCDRLMISEYVIDATADFSVNEVSEFKVDYVEINKAIAKEKRQSKKWLEKALFGDDMREK